MSQVLSFHTADELHAAAGGFVAAIVDAFAELGDDVNIALTGGSDGLATSLEFLRLVSAKELPVQVHLWWSDERYVALDDSERNDGRIVSLIENLGIGQRIVCHRAPAPGQDASIEEAAVRYAQELQDVLFACAVIGVGPDGHIASLFPRLWNKADNRSAYAVTDSPKPPAERITWSFEQIADAANLLVVASGAQKAEALSRAFSGDMELPITSIVELEATSVWVDDLAGAQFKEVSEGQS